MVGMLGFVKVYSGWNAGVCEDVQWWECWG